MGFFDDVDVNINVKAEDIEESEKKKKLASKILKALDEEEKQKEKKEEDMDDISEKLLDELMPGETKSIEDDYEANYESPFEEEKNRKETYKEKDIVEKVENKSNGNNKGTVDIQKEEPVSRHQNNNVNVTVINEDTEILGSLKSKSKICIYGRVRDEASSESGICVYENGRVGAITGSEISIYGLSTGELKGDKITIYENGRVKANIVCNGELTLFKNSYIIGEIEAENAYICGVIKGSINVKGKVTLNKDAVIEGDVTAGFISIEEGATIIGLCRQTSSKVEVEDLLKDIDFGD